jgi:hypothetical protein
LDDPSHLENIVPPGKDQAQDKPSYSRNVPVNFEALLAALACPPANVVEVWRYAITMMLVGDEGAHIIATREQDEILFVTVETDTGERFEVVRPPMSDETEQVLFEEIRKRYADQKPTTAD